MLTNSLALLLGRVSFAVLPCKVSLMKSNLSKVKYEAFGRSGCSLEDS